MPRHGIITFIIIMVFIAAVPARRHPTCLITPLACQPHCWLTVDNAQNPLKFLVD
jgi:hypothetical protein